MRRLDFLIVASLCVLLTGCRNQPEKYWIAFKDKAGNGEIRSVVSDRTLARRLKGPSQTSYDFFDEALSPVYLSALDEMRVTIVNKSRWLNSVTAYLTETQINAIRRLPFVEGVSPVQKGFRASTRGSYSVQNQTSSPIYGASVRQNATINTPAAHALGYNGSGVLIGMIDTGFNLRHEALRNVHVVRSKDFVDGDTIVAEGFAGKNNSSHGTYVLSVIAGHADGSLIGTAYGASFMLARTEDDDDLYEKAEEDNWIAALEWLEENGADVVNSSISFFDEFQNTVDRYTLDDLDGKTARTTLATDIAWSKGLLVVNSAGNMGLRGAGYLGTPSDGRHMIAVGAAAGDSMAIAESSFGPTNDGRRKPDLVALGYNVRVAGNDTAQYDNFSGTSLSAPLVTGLAALVIQAHPTWPVEKIYHAVLTSSHLVKKPTQREGRGFPDAVKAINFDAPAGSSAELRDLMAYPNPANGMAHVSFRSLTDGTYSVKIYNVLGQLARILVVNGSVSTNETINLAWDLTNSHGRDVTSGVYIYRVELNGRAATHKIIVAK